MKNLNKKIILFVFAIVFVIVGIKGDMFLGLIHQTRIFGESLIHGDIKSFATYRDKVDSITSENVSYHSQMMDLNSVKENLLGTRIIKKDESKYAKSDSGSLILSRQDVLKSEEMDIPISKIEELKSVTEENGAQFLYCAAPSKEVYETVPCNMENHDKENYYNYLSRLSEKEIPLLDFSEVLRKEGIKDEDIFFYTDHHWKPYCGFVAANAICEELKNRYGFEYDKEIADFKNYSTKEYKDWFLGSYGKKVGTYFTWQGADDFELITPKFETSMIEEQPIKGETREGAFEETALYTENLEKDYYKYNTYATYCGGDFRLQIIKNNMKQDGKKVIIIRDSFACVVAPFLSLQTKELHICDMRDMEGLIGDKINMRDYIEEVKPDYVIVLYTRFGDSKDEDHRFDFF